MVYYCNLDRTKLRACFVEHPGDVVLFRKVRLRSERTLIIAQTM
jgi:hypothetical protein